MKKIFKAFLLICWLAFIYMMSAKGGEGSSDLSFGLLRDICEFLKLNNIDEFILRYHSIFRKLAHFGEYFILSFLIYINLIEYYKKANILTVCIILCAIYAISDEIHQFFVPGRFCSFFDVLIDTSGGVTCSLIIHLVHMICYQEKKH